MGNYKVEFSKVTILVRFCIAGNVDGFCLLCSFRAHVEYSLASVERVISPWKFVDNLSCILYHFHIFLPQLILLFLCIRSEVIIEAV